MLRACRSFQDVLLRRWVWFHFHQTGDITKKHVSAHTACAHTAPQFKPLFWKLKTKCLPSNTGFAWFCKKSSLLNSKLSNFGGANGIDWYWLQVYVVQHSLLPWLQDDVELDFDMLEHVKRSFFGGGDWIPSWSGRVAEGPSLGYRGDLQGIPRLRERRHPFLLDVIVNPQDLKLSIFDTRLVWIRFSSCGMLWPYCWKTSFVLKHVPLPLIPYPVYEPCYLNSKIASYDCFLMMWNPSGIVNSYSEVFFWGMVSTGVCSGWVMSLAALLQFNGLRKVCWGVTMPLELLGHGLNSKTLGKILVLNLLQFLRANGWGMTYCNVVPFRKCPGARLPRRMTTLHFKGREFCASQKELIWI